MKISGQLVRILQCSGIVLVVFARVLKIESKVRK